MAARDVFPVRPVGDRACIIDLPDLERVLGAAERLRELGIAGVVDIVPAARTVLVRCEDRASVRLVEQAVADFDPRVSTGGGAGREVTIDVVYDGDDLDEVGELTGLGADGVVAAHTGTAWQAAFGGFAPGFAYLCGGDPRLDVPRLDSPRTAVPAGSVAIAGGYSAVYPGASPGGWRLLGRTEQRMWDEARDTPALVAPGDTVRFRAVRAHVVAAPDPADSGSEDPDPGAPDHGAPDPGAPDPGAPDPDAPDPAAPDPAAPEPAFTVVRPGLLTLVQDGGRSGYAALGVTESGALDRAALRRANRAVGNALDAAGLESLNGGLVMRAERELLVAVAGTDAEVRVGKAEGATAHSVTPGHPFALLPGETLRIGTPSNGLRCYVAIRGGVSAPAVLGSRSHDSLSGLGPPPVVAEQGFAVGPEPQSGSGAEVHEPLPDPGTAVLRFVPGPRDDWFLGETAAAFAARRWLVTAQSNRVGVRLDGESLERGRPGELPTEGMVRGSIQVPPSGLPVLFLADHPVTGGYPVIGTVVDADLDRAAQLRPGEEVRFEAVDPDDVGSARTFAAPVPERVSFSIEVDGRRYVLTVPGALAVALDRVLGEADDAQLAEALAPFVAACLDPEIPDP